jgi:FkbM family methyltransferase
MTPNSENVRKELHNMIEKENDRVKNVDEIPPAEDFDLDYKSEENKLYLPYRGKLKDVFFDVRVKDIETKDNIFSADNLRFNNSEYINWISPNEDLCLKNPDFLGFEVDYLKGDEIIFSRQLKLKEKKIETKPPIEFKKVDPTKNSKDLFVVLTYPDTKIKVFTTEKCLNSLKDAGLKILLASHYPVIKELQDKVDYYLYDSYNPLIEHTLYNFYWSQIGEGKAEIRLDKLQKKSNLNQSLTVLTNIENAIKFAKTAGYDNIVSVSYDFILNSGNIELIKNILDRMRKENKKGYFMRYKEEDRTLYKSVFFVVNVDFYTKIFDKRTRTPEEYNAECQRLGAHNFLENYFYKKLLPYANELIIEDTDEEKLFKNPNINIFSGCEYLALLPVKDQSDSFMIWFTSSNNKDDRRIEFTFDNNGKIERSTHYIKNRTYYSKKITLKDGDNYNITASFIDSALQKEIDKQTFNINLNNYQSILENGLFTEFRLPDKSEIKEMEAREIKSKIEEEKVFAGPASPDHAPKLLLDKEEVTCAFNMEENKIYFTYNGKDPVSYDVWVVDIDSYFPIFCTKIDFSESSRNYWIFAGEPLYKMYEQFNGYKILFKDKQNGNILLERDIKIRDNPSVCKTKFQFETPCLEFRNYFEAFYDEVWKDLNLSDKDICVVDLGSGVGTFIAYALEKGVKNIIGVEVDDKCYRSTLNTFKNNNNVSFINKAIYSESDKELTFHFWMTENTTYAGTLIEDWIKKEHESGNIITKKVKTITIDDILRMYNISKINAMKIDIEGGEYEIFDKISSFTLSRIDRILLEFHMNNDNRLNKVIDKMINNGFKYTVNKMRSKFLNNRDIDINDGLGMGTVIFYR